MNEMKIGVLYLRHTAPEGRTWVDEHWYHGGDEGRERFLKSRMDDKAKAQADFLEKNPEAVPVAKIEVLTKAEYMQQRWNHG